MMTTPSHLSSPGAQLPIRPAPVLRESGTVFSDNAQAFASRPETYVDAERHSAVREAVALLREGHRGRAEYVMARSFMRQARIAGLGHTDLTPCACCGLTCTQAVTPC